MMLHSNVWKADLQQSNRTESGGHSV